MKLALAILTALAACAMFVAFLASAMWLLFRASLPPCAEESVFYVLAQLLVPVSCFISTVWLGVLARRPNGRRLPVALALPGAALLLVWGLAALDSQAQRRCKAQTLAQAKASCRINPAFYRDGRDRYGYQTVTLIAPGTTDRAYDCLWRWTQHNDAASLEIDPGVYGRDTPTAPPSPR